MQRVTFLLGAVGTLAVALAQPMAHASTNAMWWTATAGDTANTIYPTGPVPLAWLEHKLTADDGVASNQFGWHVVIAGSTAFVGASMAAVNDVPQQGTVYVFKETGGIWTQVQKLTASDGAEGDQFGASIAVSGTTALIGSISATIDGHENQGAVYVFTESGGSWSETQKLVSSDGAEADDFGYALKMSDTTALIGAPFADVNGNDTQGALYVFNRDAGGWIETQKLVVSDGLAGDMYGVAVALEGDRALISAQHATINGNTSQGAVYALANVGGNWQQTQKILASDAAIGGDQFGTTVSISGTAALVTAAGAIIGENGRQGAAYILNESGGNWTETHKLVAPDGAANDNHGFSGALLGDTALVGAPFAAVNKAGAQGAVYAYTKSGADWAFSEKLTASDGAATSFYGWSVALDAQRALIGAIGTTVNGEMFQGAGYVYDRIDDGIFCSGFEAGEAGACVQ